MLETIDVQRVRNPVHYGEELHKADDEVHNPEEDLHNFPPR
jgi:hypothetical protein